MDWCTLPTPSSKRHNANNVKMKSKHETSRISCPRVTKEAKLKKVAVKITKIIAQINTIMNMKTERACTKKEKNNISCKKRRKKSNSKRAIIVIVIIVVIVVVVVVVVVTM